MISNEVYVASTRFGLGIRPEEVNRISEDPTQWLIAQIASPQMRGDDFASLPSSAENIKRMYAFKEDKKEAAQSGNAEAEQKEKQEALKQMFINELRAKLQLAMATSTPFYERLVDFWGNHFAVSVKKGPVRALAGAYEREAIRPYVMGRFSDMLLAVAHHPAMLVYLDNAQSIGPNSVAGLRRDKGLNENLAREIMELHTLGVNGGYTQTDVTTFAKVITGWTVAPANSDNPGIFQFVPRRHEPGTQHILGRSYEDTGEEQGIRVLNDLAHNPATARHIATKLARHFIADTPPEEAVNELSNVFQKTGGDLPSLYRSIIHMAYPWDTRTYPKIKSGYDLVISAARLTSQSGDKAVDYSLAALKFLSDIPYTADSPAGTPDTIRDIGGPDAMVRRVQWAQAAANKLETSNGAMELAMLSIGPIITDNTRAAIADARHGHEALAILFGSPEFQRR